MAVLVASHHESYKYARLQELDALRILVLHPASNSADPLHCDLVTTRLADCRYVKNEYHAVSYCCGDPVLCGELFCEGKTIPLTYNADTLLRNFRKQHKSHRLWLDSVCINQQDIREKDDQIALMGQIYRCAARVHVWLGEATEFDETAFAILREAVIFEASDSLRRWRTDQQQEPFGFRIPSQPLHIADSFGPILALLSRPYFTRRWILQELGLGHDATFHCGNLSISRGVFRQALDRLHFLASDKAEKAQISRVGAICSLERRPQTYLLTLLLAYRTAACSDPRDRIFSLLSLADDRWIGSDHHTAMARPDEIPHAKADLANERLKAGVGVPEFSLEIELEDAEVPTTGDEANALAFTPTYSNAYPVTYHDFALSCISAGHAVEILCFAVRFPLPESAGKPSWIPDWSMSRPDECLPYTREQLDSLDHVSKPDTALSPSTLILPDGSGFWLTRKGYSSSNDFSYSTRQVSWAGMPLPKDATTKGIAAVLRNWLSRFIVDGPLATNEEGWYSAYTSYPAFKRAKELNADGEKILRGGEVRRNLSEKEQNEHYQAVQNAVFIIEDFWGANAATPEDTEERELFQGGCKDTFTDLFAPRFSSYVRKDADKVYVRARMFGIDSAGYIPIRVLPKFFCTILCDQPSSDPYPIGLGMNCTDWFDRTDVRRCGFMELLQPEIVTGRNGAPGSWWEQLHTWRLPSDRAQEWSSRAARIDAFCSSLIEVARGHTLCMSTTHALFHDFRENYHTDSYTGWTDEPVPMDERDLFLGPVGTRPDDLFVTWSKFRWQISMVFGQSNINEGYRLLGDAKMLSTLFPQKGRENDILVNA